VVLADQPLHRFGGADLRLELVGRELLAVVVDVSNVFGEPREGRLDHAVGDLGGEAHDLVEAHHRDIVGHAQRAREEGLQGAQRQQVVRDEERLDR